MIALDAVSLRQGAFALDGITMAIPSGSYAVLTGPTGCGKTTILEAIAGLRPLAGGTIRLRDRDVSRLPPAERMLGYVPQDGAVFPTMTVADNLAFGLTVRGIRAPERVVELARWLGLTAILDRKALGLSGGEAQRVALGRALAFQPDVLLLDEPLVALDDATRDGLLGLLDDVKQSKKVTVLHVTHSEKEVDRMADVRLRLRDGCITIELK